MIHLMLLPVLIPLLASAVCMLFRGNLAIQRIISGIVAVALPLIGLWLTMYVRENGAVAVQLGQWPGAFGIVFTVDLFSALMIFLSGVVQLGSWLFLVCGSMKREHEGFLVHPLFLLLVCGVNWAFSTSDLFNMFVSFEIILLATFALQAYGNESSQIRETVKFVVLNFIASLMFLASAGFAYGLYGTLNMAELAVKIAESGMPPQAVVLGMMFLIVFGMKAAIFPLFFWLPDAYPKAPRGIIGYFSGILTKVGVYCLYRVFTIMFPDPTAMENWFQPLLLAIGGITMVVGVLGALSQDTIRRILCFHIVSQIGYMIFGLGIFTPLGVAAGMFALIHNGVVKSSLFLIGDAVEMNEGTQKLKKLGGLMTVYPSLALLFVLAAFSLAGIPPLSGFYGKMGLAMEGMIQGHFITVTLSLVTSVLTLSCMVKIWRYTFWGERKKDGATAPVHLPSIRAASGLVIASILVAIFSGWVMNLCFEASTLMFERTDYISAVLGDRGVVALETAIAEASR